MKITKSTLKQIIREEYMQLKEKHNRPETLGGSSPAEEFRKDIISRGSGHGTRPDPERAAGTPEQTEIIATRELNKALESVRLNDWQDALAAIRKAAAFLEQAEGGYESIRYYDEE